MYDSCSKLVVSWKTLKVRPIFSMLSHCHLVRWWRHGQREQRLYWDSWESIWRHPVIPSGRRAGSAQSVTQICVPCLHGCSDTGLSLWNIHIALPSAMCINLCILSDQTYNFISYICFISTYEFSGIFPVYRICIDNTFLPSRKEVGSFFRVACRENVSQRPDFDTHVWRLIINRIKWNIKNNIFFITYCYIIVSLILN